MAPLPGAGTRASVQTATTQPVVGVCCIPSRSDELCIGSLGINYTKRSRNIWVSCLHRLFAHQSSNGSGISIKGSQVKRPSSSQQTIGKPLSTRLRIRVIRKTSTEFDNASESATSAFPVLNRVRQCVLALRVSCSLPLRHISHSHLCTVIPLGVRCWKKLQ